MILINGGDEVIKAIIKILAKNPPSIAIVFAGMLALCGQMKEARDFLLAGILLQSLWILAKYSVLKR